MKNNPLFTLIPTEYKNINICKCLQERFNIVSYGWRMGNKAQICINIIMDKKKFQYINTLEFYIAKEINKL